MAEITEVLIRHNIPKEKRNQILAYFKGKSLIVSIGSVVAERAVAIFTES
ncbi:MAG: hypothetical protein ACREBQ_14090 [Nitrososphaerales archaeon]